MSRPVILFDGVCNLCNGAVDFIIRHDADEQFLFASLQSAEGRRLLGEADAERPELESLVLLEDDAVYDRSDAVIAIARGLGFPWNLAAAGLVLPKPWRDALYDWIARNRYRWFGRRDSCRLPTPQERTRFLDGDHSDDS